MPKRKLLSNLKSLTRLGEKLDALANGKGQYLFFARVCVFLLYLAFAWAAPKPLPHSAAQMSRGHLLKHAFAGCSTYPQVFLT